jgi:hypothetical protein
MESLLGQIAKEREIVIELESVPEGLVEELQKLDFVLSGTQLEGGEISVKVPKEGDYRKTISQFFFKKDLAPLSMSVKSFSLEEAFVTITKENVERFAAMGGEK